MASRLKVRIGNPRSGKVLSRPNPIKFSARKMKVDRDGYTEGGKYRGVPWFKNGQRMTLYAVTNRETGQQREIWAESNAMAIATAAAGGWRMSNPKKKKAPKRRASKKSVGPKRKRARVRTRRKPARVRSDVTMAKRKRRSRRRKNPVAATPKANPRRRRRSSRRRKNPVQNPRRRRHSSRRRRRNPNLPPVVSALIGVTVGAGAGVGVAYGLDKLGVGTPQARNWGMTALGVVAAGAIGMLSKGRSIAGASLGAGIASVGLTRALAASSTASTGGQALAGLGTGDGNDIAGAFDQIGFVQPGGVDEGIGEIGYVVDDYS